jgi:hypothetical protein
MREEREEKQGKQGQQKEKQETREYVKVINLYTGSEEEYCRIIHTTESFFTVETTFGNIRFNRKTNRSTVHNNYIIGEI